MSERPVTVRPATEADAELLLRWRNDAESRRWSRTSGVVSPEEHRRWLRDVLASPDRLLYIAEAGGPVGTVRFDLTDAAEDTWEVSITVAPEWRGRGLAGPVLAEGERAVRARRRPRTLLASVHEENTASVVLFRNAGYVPESAAGPFRVLRKALDNA
ncbi:GNAT family N-acetyltransferase [Prauserella oleivorans]|uniref:GNAT family N-acetyltransferase n=1 Tax=Prauserella oleivorans TaxID=1478153 RepID=A0ABW5WL07_9PSEU